MRTILIASVLMLAACKTAPGSHKPVEPSLKVVEKPAQVYVAIDKELTKRCPWKRKIKPSESLAGAKERGDCLDQYERQLGAIEQVQGRAAGKEAE